MSYHNIGGILYILIVRSKSFAPPSTRIQCLVSVVKLDLRRLDFCNVQNENLTLTKCQALWEIEMQLDMLIKPSEKGGKIGKIMRECV